MYKPEVGDYSCPVLSEIQAALHAIGKEDGQWEDVVERLMLYQTGAAELSEYEHIDQEHAADYMNALWTVFTWKGQMYKVNYHAVSHEGIVFEDYLVKAKPVTKKTKEVTVYE